MTEVIENVGKMADTGCSIDLRRTPSVRYHVNLDEVFSGKLTKQKERRYNDIKNKAVENDELQNGRKRDAQRQSDPLKKVRCNKRGETKNEINVRNNLEQLHNDYKMIAQNRTSDIITKVHTKDRNLPNTRNATVRDSPRRSLTDSENNHSHRNGEIDREKMKPKVIDAIEKRNDVDESRGSPIREKEVFIDTSMPTYPIPKIATPDVNKRLLRSRENSPAKTVYKIELPRNRGIYRERTPSVERQRGRAYLRNSTSSLESVRMSNGCAVGAAMQTSYDVRRASPRKIVDDCDVSRHSYPGKSPSNYGNVADRGLDGGAISSRINDSSSRHSVSSNRESTPSSAGRTTPSRGSSHERQIRPPPVGKASPLRKDAIYTETASLLNTAPSTDDTFNRLSTRTVNSDENTSNEAVSKSAIYGSTTSSSPAVSTFSSLSDAPNFSEISISPPGSSKSRQSLESSSVRASLLSNQGSATNDTNSYGSVANEAERDRAREGLEDTSQKGGSSETPGVGIQQISNFQHDSSSPKSSPPSYEDSCSMSRQDEKYWRESDVDPTASHFASSNATDANSRGSSRETSSVLETTNGRMGASDHLNPLTPSGESLTTDRTPGFPDARMTSFDTRVTSELERMDNEHQQAKSSFPKGRLFLRQYSKNRDAGPSRGIDHIRDGGVHSDDEIDDSSPSESSVYSEYSGGSRTPSITKEALPPPIIVVEPEPPAKPKFKLFTSSSKAHSESEPQKTWNSSGNGHQTYIMVAILVSIFFNCPIGLIAVYMSISAQHHFEGSDVKRGEHKARVSLILSMFGVVFSALTLLAVVYVITEFKSD